MKRISSIPSLGHALLGLLHQKPASGYDLRKIFSATSMKTYSDSPGAIYPALRRLEQQGLIRGQIEKSSGLRRRQTFRLTPMGLRRLKEWIALPVTREDLLWNQQEILLRFAFCDRVLGPAASAALLQSLQGELMSYVRGLHREFENIQAGLPLSGRLAFEWGVRATESFLGWTEKALATYRQHTKGSL